MRARLFSMGAAVFLLGFLPATVVSQTKLQRQGNIHGGVQQDDPEAIRKAIESGQDINTIGQGGQSPLMAAVLMGKEKAVKYLLEAKADTMVAEKDGYTPMHGAGFQGRPEIAKMLIAARMDPSLRHSDGYTPIHRGCWGSEKRHTEFVQVLLEAGVPYDEKDGQGRLPIDNVRDNKRTKVLLTKWAKKKKEL
eukprot:gnl/TRDRNA2_/TRDRNA2_186119_c0_seq1.p1 gnl/TRDRNA2_/TRDRNA2_186119_c0~~gnl/TRDRNA2_/TRDRNA2_186119_c0_seq1.p1  ORF type:complete len:193 (-),score=45.01 gnl/TRDRNA2_/TRDRNA2_186119_c0_seq1:71-649(-)